MSGLIDSHREMILAGWRQFAARAPFAAGLSLPELDGVMPRYLQSLGCGDRDGAVALSVEQQALIEQHLADRIRQGSTLNEILTEFANLAHCIATAIHADGDLPAPPPWAAALVLSELNTSCLEAMKIFTEHVLEDAQSEKLYLSQLQTIAEEAASQSDGLERSRATLGRALGVVTRAMSAQSGALLLFDVDEPPHAPDRAAAVRSWVDEVASRREPTAIVDVADTDLATSETLRRGGVHSLLGVRLHSRGRVQGVMYVGVRERRAFSASDMRRLQALGVAMSQHVHTLQTIWVLRRGAEHSAGELRQRQRLAAMIVGDLRSQLIAAKAALAPRGRAGRTGANGVAVDMLIHLACLDELIDDLWDACRARGEGPPGIGAWHLEQLDGDE